MKDRAHSRFRRFFIGAGTLAVVLLVVGCGSSSEDSTSAAGLTKSALIKQGDAICAKADKKQEADYGAYVQSHTTPAGVSPEKQQEEVILEVGLPPVREEIEQLGELPAAEGDEAEFAAIVNGLEKALASAEDDPNSITARLDSPFVEVEKRARAYGFKVCGQV